jgi:hypothetical protein
VPNLQPCTHIFAAKAGKKQDIPFAISVTDGDCDLIWVIVFAMT